jgi:hypothetical protein
MGEQEEEDTLGLGGERADDTRGVDALLHIEIGRGLVKQIDLGISNAGERTGKALQLTTRQILWQ